MARLIKRRTQPIKFQALSPALILPTNRLLSREDLIAWENLPKKYAQFEQQVRDLINNYQLLYVNKGALAYKRGQINQRSIIIANIFAHAKSWKEHLNSETEAIISLAEKLSETMLNSPNKLISSSENYQFIFNKLKEYFYIKITLPQKLYALMGHFDCHMLLTVSEHDREPQATLCINRQVHILSLADINLERILR